MNTLMLFISLKPILPLHYSLPLLFLDNSHRHVYYLDCRSDDWYWALQAFSMLTMQRKE